MSGGSFDYLFLADTPAEAARKGYSLRRMAEALEQEAPDHPVTHYTKRLVEIGNDDIPQPVKDVWHAMEWNRSADWGQDQLDEALDTASTWRPYTSDPLHEGRDVASAYRAGLADGKRNVLVELARLTHEEKP